MSSLGEHKRGYEMIGTRKIQNFQFFNYIWVYFMWLILIIFGCIKSLNDKNFRDRGPLMLMMRELRSLVLKVVSKVGNNKVGKIRFNQGLKGQ